MSTKTPDQEFVEICEACKQHASQLVAVCDGAMTRDNHGFSKADVRIGRVMAFTPAEHWSLDLLTTGLQSLKTYSRTQLAHAHDEIHGWNTAASQWQAQKAKLGRTGYIRPILGVEKTASGEEVVVLHSCGYGDPAQEKNLKDILADLSAKYDASLGTYKLPTCSGMTTEYSAHLKALLAMVDPLPVATGRLAPLIASATPTTMFVRVCPMDPKAIRIYTPYIPTFVSELHSSTTNSLKFFSKMSGNYWTVTPHSTDVPAINTLLAKYHLHICSGVTDLLHSARLPAPIATIPQHRLFMEEGKIAVTVPKYNERFNAWLKHECPGCIFKKEPGLNRWLVNTHHAHHLEPLNIGLLPIGVPNYFIPDEVSTVIVDAKKVESIFEKRRLALGAISSSLKVSYHVNPGLRGTLRPFQTAAVAYWETAATPHKGIKIGDEMGLGKTIEGLACMHHKDAFPLVITCPASAARNWQREATKWLPANHKASIIGPSTIDDLLLHRADVWILSFDQLRRWQKLISLQHPKGVIFDESHMLADPKSQRSQAAKALAETIPWRIVMTGTMQKAKNADLIHQLELINRLEDLGGFLNFTTRYCGAFRGEFGNWNMDANTNTEELRDVLRETCMIRREKALVAPELPPKVHSIVEVSLSNQREYDDCLRSLYQHLLDEGKDPAKIGKAHAIVLITALRKLSGRGKINSALDWTEDFTSGGEKLIVYAKHKEVVDAWRATAPDALIIDGSTTLKRRDEAVEKFQNDPKANLIVLSDAGGISITLTAASSILITERCWGPAEIDQIIDRAHRIGQTAPSVNVYHLVAPNTIDTDMMRIEKSKRANIDIFNGHSPDMTALAEEIGVNQLLKEYTERAKQFEKEAKQSTGNIIPVDEPFAPSMSSSMSIGA